MKIIKKVGFWGLAVVFIVAPFTSGLAVTGPPQGAAEEIRAALKVAVPNFIASDRFEFYPLAIDTLGFQSILVLTNLVESTGSFQICRVPAGTTQFSCTGVSNLLPAKREFSR
jgi:hypothetical protein